MKARKPKTLAGWIMLETVNPQPNTKPHTKLAKIGMAQPPKTWRDRATTTIAATVNTLVAAIERGDNRAMPHMP